MVGHAFQVEKCSYNFYEADGLHLVTLHQLVRGCISRQHPHLQQELGRSPATHLAGP